MMSTRSGSFKSYICSQYGVETKRLVNVYSKELQRRARFANHHLFSLRCLKSYLVPASLRIKSPVLTERAKSAATRVSRTFLQERVKTSRQVRNHAISQAREYRAKLQGILSSEDFEKTERICTKTAEKTFQRGKERQSKIRRQGLKGNNKKQDDGIKSKAIARIPFKMELVKR